MKDIFSQPPPHSDIMGAAALKTCFHLAGCSGSIKIRLYFIEHEPHIMYIL